MTTSINDSDLSRIKGIYSQLLQAIANGEASLQYVKTLGTQLVSDPIYSQTYGSVAGFPQFISSDGALINTLFSSWVNPPNPIIFNFS